MTSLRFPQAPWQKSLTIDGPSWTIACVGLSFAQQLRWHIEAVQDLIGHTSLGALCSKIRTSSMSALPLLDFDSSDFSTAKGQDDQNLPDTTQNNDSKPGSMKNVPCFQVFCSGLSPHTAGCRDRPILETSPSVAIRKAQLSHSPHRRSALDYVYVYNRISRRQQMAALTKGQAALRQSAGCHSIL